MKDWRIESQRTVTVESYVTLRREWSHGLAFNVAHKYQARGHRVVDGIMTWKYFEDPEDARKWSDAIHTGPLLE
jgi:hypothetical protein